MSKKQKQNNIKNEYAKNLKVLAEAVEFREKKWFRAVAYAKRFALTFAVAITFIVIASFIIYGLFGFLFLFYYLILIPSLVILNLNKRYQIQAGSYIEIDHKAYGWVSLIFTVFSPLSLSLYTLYSIIIEFQIGTTTSTVAGVFLIFGLIAFLIILIFGFVCSLTIMKVSDLFMEEQIRFDDEQNPYTELKIRDLENRLENKIKVLTKTIAEKGNKKNNEKTINIEDLNSDANLTEEIKN